MLFDWKQRAGLVRGRLLARALAGLRGQLKPRGIMCREGLSERPTSSSFAGGLQGPKKKADSEKQQQRESGKPGSRIHQDLFSKRKVFLQVLQGLDC